MSGPFAETAPLYVRALADVVYWPLQRWAEAGEARIECGECEAELLAADGKDQPFMLADLAARIEAHVPKCPGVRDRS